MSGRSKDPLLLPQHAALIRNSAISDAVAKARGYRSITTRSELERLGFSKPQRIVPCLLTPIHDVHGQIATYQIRPDEPRIKNGKPVKYETPSGSRMVLDVPPMARRWLGDPRRPLFLTEGVRKGDAVVSRGLCCIVVLSVWGWRGTNEHGGKTALTDWEVVALNGREVFVVFDGDVVTKIEVWKALQRLEALLESRGANVRVIRLPMGEGGSKVGVDDYLAAGHTVEDLMALAVAELRAPEDQPETPSTAPYLVENGSICVEKDTRDGPVIVPLCNFDARIIEEVTLDDGDEHRREFVISCTLSRGKRLPEARVPTDHFSNMGWITNSWGVDAVPAAGFGKRDQLREAIQRLSGDVARRRIYAHTGWREIERKHFYLTASGAIGRSDLEVDLGRELSRYRLPQEPTNVVEAVRRSLKLLDVATISVTAPMWAAVFRAPLAALHPVDLYLWIEGFTGSLKSTLAALFLCHWGTFDRKTLPESWESTANVLEKRAHMLKDAVLVVDDYAPGPLDVRDYRIKAARLLRSQGNLSGRGRLRSDLTERRTFYPRGLILSTGEQRPTGQSVLARGFLLDLDRRQVDLKRLTEAQSHATELAHAMAGYVQWLAPQFKTLGTTLAEAFESARARASAVGTHLRHPEALAHLWLGTDCGLAFAEEIGAIDPAEATDLRSSFWGTFMERAKVLSKLVDEERPTRRFAQILWTLLLQKRVVLLPRDADRTPQQDERLIGWQDSDYLYLIPEAAFRAISQFARDSSDPFPVDRTRLQQDFVREGIADHAKGRTTTTDPVVPSELARLSDEDRKVLFEQLVLEDGSTLSDAEKLGAHHDAPRPEHSMDARS